MGNLLKIKCVYSRVNVRERRLEVGGEMGAVPVKVNKR
jgi:hypothetical protein